ncbi:cuticle protein 38-like [Lucilia cuprina]|uniref:cuticle protein 38-like n=1 Tax=Lucilia cuprina TaxID=7375 RepID=UPI001F06500D|nr:cuticle protein 38-like [Lucilia cuprina]
MFKYAVVIFAVIVCAAAKPGFVAPLTYTAPAGLVTATSSQFVARNHNGIATAPVVAPVAAPVAAYTAPVAAAYTAPVVAKYAAAYSTPLAYSAPVAAAYSAPLTYAATPLAYANAHLDAAYASSRVDLKQNYNAAVVPASYAAAPVLL